MKAKKFGMCNVHVCARMFSKCMGLVVYSGQFSVLVQYIMSTVT